MTDLLCGLLLNVQWKMSYKLVPNLIKHSVCTFQLSNLVFCIMSLINTHGFWSTVLPISQIMLLPSAKNHPTANRKWWWSRPCWHTMSWRIILTNLQNWGKEERSAAALLSILRTDADGSCLLCLISIYLYAAAICQLQFGSAWHDLIITIITFSGDLEEKQCSFARLMGTGI